MTYLYETISTRQGDVTKRYEIKQSIHDAPLARHPETGGPISRVILGGWGLVTSKSSSGNSSRGECGCGPTGCC